MCMRAHNFNHEMQKSLDFGTESVTAQVYRSMANNCEKLFILLR